MTNDAEVAQVFAAATPHGRPGAPDDVAPAAACLTSNESSRMTGESSVTCGGHRFRPA